MTEDRIDPDEAREALTYLINKNLGLLPPEPPLFRIYDLHNNPLSTEELHRRVFDWYAKQAEAKEAVRFVEENRHTFSNNNPSDASWLHRSRGQRGRSRRRRTP